MSNKSMHMPFYNYNGNSDTIVIFIHGILESPAQFKPLANIVLSKGYAISAILLDGHGKNGKDFAIAV